MVNPPVDPASRVPNATASRRPSAYMSTMVLPMVNPDTPEYEYPGTGPGENNVLWDIYRNAPGFSWPPPLPPRSNTYINDHRTGERREVVLPPIHAMLRNPPIDLITQTPTYQQPVIGGFPASRPPSPGVTSLSLPPPPGLVHPSLLTQTPITTQQSRPLTEGTQSFRLVVILEKEKSEGTKSKPKVTRKKEQCGCPGTLDLLSATFSRDDLLSRVFSAVGLEHKYVAKSGPGPTVTAFWTGQGGCTNSPFNVTTDSQWDAFKTVLANTPKSVSDVKVNVNWKEMKKWKPSNDSDSDDELAEGTQVPTVGRFTDEDHVLAGITVGIKEAWKCSRNLHATCVDTRDNHVQIHRMRLREWASRIKASGGTLSPKEGPSDDLLDRWGIKPAPLPRGRAGPNAQNPPPPTTSSQDQMTMLTTALVAAVTDSLIRRRSPSPGSPSKSSKRPRESPSPSPPPPIGEELKVFLNGCAKKVRVPQDVMDKVISVLDKEGYTPEALGHRNLDRGEIVRLTGLPEGTVMSIHAHAEEWCGHNRAKKRQFSHH